MQPRPTPPQSRTPSTEPIGTLRDYVYVFIGAVLTWLAVFAVFVSIPG